MMRAEILRPSTAIDLDPGALLDSGALPWRRIVLSARDNIWTLVDAVDFPWLSENLWNVWHAGGRRGLEWQKYAKRNTGPERSTVRMHREIVIHHDPRDEVFMASHFVDHGNGQTLDNRLENLGWATRLENGRNRRARGAAPSLDSILLGLMAAHGFCQPQEVPF